MHASSIHGLADPSRYLYGCFDDHAVDDFDDDRDDLYDHDHACEHRPFLAPFSNFL
jgi:hypothetical protein